MMQSSENKRGDVGGNTGHENIQIRTNHPNINGNMITSGNSASGSSAPILSGIETIAIGIDGRRKGEASLASASGSSLFPRNLDI